MRKVGGDKMLKNKLTFKDDMHKEIQLRRQHIKDCFEKLNCFLMHSIGKRADSLIQRNVCPFLSHENV